MEETEIFDPSLLTYFKLSIGEVLKAIPYENKSSIFILNKNKFRLVDLIANICNVYDMDRLFKVYLTDGTGFIPCTIWKKESSFPKELSNLSDTMSPEEELLVKSLHKSLSLFENYEPKIGQSIHVRGRINCYHDQRELTAFYYRLVVNKLEVEHRLEEVKELRSKIYNQFWSTKSEYFIKESLRLQSVNKIKTLISNHLQLNSLGTFSLADLCLTDNLLHSIKESDPKHYLGSSLREKMSNVIQHMMEDGLVFLSDQNMANNQYYHLTKLCYTLQQTFRRHMKKLTNTTLANDYGVSAVELLKELNKTEELRHLTKEALKVALNCYEETGLIYGCAKNQYRLV